MIMGRHLIPPGEIMMILMSISGKSSSETITFIGIVSYLQITDFVAYKQECRVDREWESFDANQNWD